MTSRFFIFVFLFLSACTPKDTLPNQAAAPAVKTFSLENETGSAALTIVSWNMKHLGRKNQNTEVAAELLKTADIITLQEVNSSESGQDALMRLATQLRKQVAEDRICVGLSETPSDGRERYGYLWKDRRVAYVKSNGEVMDTCPSSAITIRLEKRFAARIVREPSFGTFLARASQTKFVLASIHLVPSGKKPQLEVPPLFDSLKDAEWPIIVAGDYNLDSGHSAFNGARAARFQAAFVGAKTSLKSKKRELSKPYDNFWFRGAELKSAKVINLYAALPQIPQGEIYESISDHCPIVGEFTVGPTQLRGALRAPTNHK